LREKELFLPLFVGMVLVRVVKLVLLIVDVKLIKIVKVIMAAFTMVVLSMLV